MLFHSLIASALLLASSSCAVEPGPSHDHHEPGKPKPGHGHGHKKPNIVFILSDDQDRLLGSMDYQSVLKREILDKGTEFTNHYGTTAQCCPARASLHRGQYAHNTNITHVNGAGGNYDKWLISKQDEDYLPLWLNNAGYRTEYVGKFLNGYSTHNWEHAPKHWDWMDTLIDPYTTYFNVPVLSQNGERPIWYKGFHQTDVLRIKALDRLDRLADSGEPFYLTIAPYAPHVQNPAHRPIPLKRHQGMFSGAKAPRTPNYNPSDEIQSTKGSWLRGLPKMNESVMEYADFNYESRVEALQGVDEIIEDVIKMLEDKDIIDNTYIVYTSDNGYHIGQNRIPSGKALFYNEDTNLPFAVRGPGIPKGVKSGLPSTHVDLAPTFLDIAGVSKKDLPSFLDGHSLLDQWRKPHRNSGKGHGKGNAKETLNIEFWGLCTIEAPNRAELGAPFQSNSYKTVRILGEDEGWLFTRWCTGDSEMYHTTTDQYEMKNLVDSEDPYHKRAFTRLNAILMVTKSCEKGSCRDPWSVFDIPGTRKKLQNFEDAMNPKYDSFFEEFPRVAFGECMAYQYAPNEGPFYPPLPEGGDGGLGRAERAPTDNFVQSDAVLAITDKNEYGDEEQRRATLKDVYAQARVLTWDELGREGEGVEKRWAATGEVDMRLEGFD